MGISGCLCAELLAGIDDGSAIKVETSCDTFVGKLVGNITGNVIQLMESDNTIINICCKDICSIRKLPILPLAYVTIFDGTNGNTVDVINTNTDTVINTITVGRGPIRVAITSDGSKAYVVNN